MDAVQLKRLKELAAYLIEEKDSSTTRACRVVNLPRSMWYYTSVKDDTELEAKLEELAITHNTPTV